MSFGAWELSLLLLALLVVGTIVYGFVWTVRCFTDSPRESPIPVRLLQFDVPLLAVMAAKE